jgi:hypothetical protein
MRLLQMLLGQGRLLSMFNAFHISTQLIITVLFKTLLQKLGTDLISSKNSSCDMSISWAYPFNKIIMLLIK